LGTCAWGRIQASHCKRSHLLIFSTLPHRHCKYHLHSQNLIELGVKEIITHISPTLSSSYCHNTRFYELPVELKHKKILVFLSLKQDVKSNKLCPFLSKQQKSLLPVHSVIVILVNTICYYSICIYMYVMLHLMSGKFCQRIYNN